MFKKLSLEPDSNQRPKDICHCLYSPPLYQLSYQGMSRNHAIFKSSILVKRMA